MAEILQIGDPPIAVTLRRSRAARRLSLRVSGLDGKVSLTVPLRGSTRDAVTFLREKEPWIRSHLSKTPEVAQVQIGVEIPIEGRMHLIRQHAGRAVKWEAHDILVPSGTDKAARRIQAYLKTLARDRLVTASEKYAEQIGRPFGKVSLRDTRSRWGSCTSDGNLMYSWRLIMAPSQVLDYVAAHEVSHLVEMNHSRAFWDQVEALMPNYAAPRRWLKQHGAELHRYQFQN